MNEKKIICDKMIEAITMSNTLVINLASLAKANKLQELGNEGLAKVFENLSLILNNSKNVFELFAQEEEKRNGD